MNTKWTSAIELVSALAMLSQTLRLIKSILIIISGGLSRHGSTISIADCLRPYALKRK
jgi:hypothetical protein